MEIPQLSKSAAARVKDRLPAPTNCRYCGSPVSMCNNLELYGRPYGDWPFGYFCGFCEAYVGCHPQTDIPLGTMATGVLRKDRSAAHQAFDPLWRSKKMSRTEAYQKLADELGIPKSQCHISWFEAEECHKVIEIASRLRQKYKI